MINCFGSSVSDFLKKFAGRFKNYKTALDVGCAHGANSVYLAGLGMTVTALDIALPEDLPAAEKVSFIEQGIELWQPEQTYDLIVAFNVLQFVEKAYQPQVLAKLYQVLNPQGLLLVKAFSDKDVSCQKKVCGHFRHYELKDWAEARKMKILEYCEKEIDDNHEPLGKHRHGMVYLAAEK